MIKQAKDISNLNVYERISFKRKNNINELTGDEREKLEDLILESITERITRINDELLIEMALDEGVIL